MGFVVDDEGKIVLPPQGKKKPTPTGTGVLDPETPVYDKYGNYTAKTYADYIAWDAGGNDAFFDDLLGAQGSGGGGGGGGGWGGGGGGGAPSGTMRGWFQYYYGSTPADLIRQFDDLNYTEQDVIDRAIADGKEGIGLTILKSNVRRAAAQFYEGDPSGVPESLVVSLIGMGYWDQAGVDYLINTYFPQVKGVGANNPSATPFVDDWVDMTGRPLTTTALGKLNEIIKTYGFTDVGRAAWQNYIKTTDSAITGNWGAEHRAGIYADITSVLGRMPTDSELDPNGTLWNTNDDARLEYIRGTPEWQGIYGGMPAYMTEQQYIGEAMAFDRAFRMYYGDGVTMNDDGSLNISHGPYYQGPPPVADYTVPAYTEPTPAAAPAWKPLSMAQWQSDLAGLGITLEGGKYLKDGQEISESDLTSLLPANTYYKDA